MNLNIFLKMVLFFITPAWADGHASLNFIGQQITSLISLCSKWQIDLATDNMHPKVMMTGADPAVHAATYFNYLRYLFY